MLIPTQYFFMEVVTLFEAKKYIPGIGRHFKVSPDEIHVARLVEALKEFGMGGGGTSGMTEAEVKALLATEMSTALASYLTTTSADGKYQAKGSYALVANVYTKTETDNKYQVKGAYALSADVHTKVEADNKYQPKGTYALASNVHTKAEADAKFAPVATTYTKAEVDQLLADLRAELAP